MNLLENCREIKMIYIPGSVPKRIKKYIAANNRILPVGAALSFFGQLKYILWDPLFHKFDSRTYYCWFGNPTEESWPIIVYKNIFKLKIENYF